MQGVKRGELHRLPKVLDQFHDSQSLCVMRDRRKILFVFCIFPANDYLLFPVDFKHSSSPFSKTWWRSTGLSFSPTPLCTVLIGSSLFELFSSLSSCSGFDNKKSFLPEVHILWIQFVGRCASACLRSLQWWCEVLLHVGHLWNSWRVMSFVTRPVRVFLNHHQPTSASYKLNQRRTKGRYEAPLCHRKERNVIGFFVLDSWGKLARPFHRVHR